jgi:hypothetical protein
MNTQSDAAICDAEALLSARQLHAASNRLQDAEAAGADPVRCAAGRWMIHMLQGEFELAWQQSDAIAAHGKPDTNRLWRGEPLQGKRVILRCLHGFGDAVQFLRYAPQLRALAGSLVVEVNPRFVELARYFDGVEEVITWGVSAPAEPPQWDVQIEVMELPYLFRSRLCDLPRAQGYLNLPDSQSIEPDPSERFRVGLVWTAGAWNPERSISFSTLHPLLEVAGCEYWDLQESNAQQDSIRSEQTSSLQRNPADGQSIMGLAKRIKELDLVITVDTLAAHMAGALGTPCWLLLQHAADWRWMHERTDSPWYPTLRLFRQQAPGDWAGVIASARESLQEAVTCQRNKVLAQ